MPGKTTAVAKQDTIRDIPYLPERSRHLMDRFLKAYPQKLFNISLACKATGIGRATVYRWCKRYPWFKERMELVAEEKKDFVETALLKKVADGNAPCIIFANECLNKGRGYVKRQEVDVRAQITVRFDKEDEGL